jgi:hypothetical protein
MLMKEQVASMYHLDFSLKLSSTTGHSVDHILHECTKYLVLLSGALFLSC